MDDLGANSAIFTKYEKEVIAVGAVQPGAPVNDLKKDIGRKMKVNPSFS